MTGGGYLGFDSGNAEYAGALDLSVGEIAVKAYGLVQTRLPGGVPGYSFVAISIEFAPSIELAFGFTLDGVGGLIGVNRTISVDAVETALWAHHLDGLLFPKDPVATAPQLVAALDSYFPPAKGRYLFGPLVKIGWAADIVTGEVALLLELPEPLKVLLIGESRWCSVATAAARRAHLVRGRRRLRQEARVLRRIVARLAHRVRIRSAATSRSARTGATTACSRWRSAASSRLPASAWFPTLKRLAISITSSVAQLEAQSYFALTSNTLQFGARVELTAGTGSFNVHGWLGFDALCERHPLSFTFDLTAGVDLRHGSSVLASVHLDGTLRGPTPWHIAGEASLSLLFFDVTVHFDKTWGSTAAALPLPDPLSAVLAALADRRSWTPARSRRRFARSITPVGIAR